MPFVPEDCPDLSMASSLDDSFWSLSPLIERERNERTTISNFIDTISPQNCDGSIQSAYDQAPDCSICNKSKDLKSMDHRYPDTKSDLSSIGYVSSNLFNTEDLPFALRRRRVRAILTAQQACDIYQQGNSEEATDGKYSQSSGESLFISQHYGISPKAVRDIWNRLAPERISSLVL